jgi:hypothetical protein
MITELLFHIPNPMNTAQEFSRFYHLDIQNLSDEELSTEFYSLRSILYWLPPDKQWIKQRVQELGKEYGRRHYAQQTQPAKTTIESQSKVLRTVEL